MKIWKYPLFAIASIIAILPITTFAAITNINGIEISDEEYDNFIKAYSHEYIMTMTEKDYERLQSLDFSDVKTETKYVETTYNPSLRLTTEKEITKEEFETMPMLDSDGTYYSTTAKELELALIGGSVYNTVTVTATWKGIPSSRYFDVIGVRGYGLTFRNGSQIGKQIYVKNGNYETIDYAWNGTNIKRADNGFGISMNIVDDSITFLQAIVDCDVTPTITHPSVFGSYQHAVSKTTLADSQNYTLGVAGLGSVFVYPYSISQKYDGMSGVRLDY